MLRCNVLILGGGPAGSSCAWGLRRAGLDVIILDKSAFPRVKPCAGWITPDVVERLEIETADYAAHRTLQPIRGFRVSQMGGPEIEADYGRTVSYGILRCEFDDYLLHRSSATLRLGEPVRKIEQVGSSWRINDRFEAPLVVGAGGHFCPVARMMGARTDGAEQVVAAQVIEFGLTEAQARASLVDPEFPELYFCRDLQGYGWCLRKGNYLNVGLGREDARELPAHVHRFIDFLHQRGRIPRLDGERVLGHAYILYGHARRRIIGDGLMLVGDSAGLASSRSGEGIKTAVESGLLAAESILEAAGDYRAARLHSYTARLTSQLGPPEAADGWLSRIPSGVKMILARRLFASRWFVRRVVLDRWFLHSPGIHAATRAITRRT